MKPNQILGSRACLLTYTALVALQLFGLFSLHCSDGVLEAEIYPCHASIQLLPFV